MWKSQLLYLFLGLLFVKGSDSIKCYQCSAPCPSSMSSYGVLRVVCASYCKTASSSGYVAKGCSLPGDSSDRCWTSTIDGIDVYQCTCSSDYCNGTALPTFGVGLISALILMFLCKTLI